MANLTERASVVLGRARKMLVQRREMRITPRPPASPTSSAHISMNSERLSAGRDELRLSIADLQIAKSRCNFD